jgi:hypothetical protein
LLSDRIVKRYAEEMVPSSWRLAGNQHASIRMYLQDRPNPMWQMRCADRVAANLGEQRCE